MRHLHGSSEAVAWLRERGCRHLRADSRQIRPGEGFVAWPGAAVDGRRFVRQALDAGAAACLVERDGVEAFAFDDARIATLGQLKTACAPLAADFYGQPSEALDVVAITGTNGKTSSAWWLAQLLQAAGQASAVVGVVAVARALGVAWSDVEAACAALTPVPGRMQAVPGDAQAPLVLVDYAHTPDALEKALLALQPLAGARLGRLWCVVRCGGDRDPIKRPLMAAVAERQADELLLTSDNPRSEDPQAILAQMLAGLKAPAQARVLPDRAQAIAQAVRAAAAQDVVLIAGKGHEDYQEIRGQRHPFSDVQHAAAALAERGAEVRA